MHQNIRRETTAYINLYLIYIIAIYREYDMQISDINKLDLNYAKAKRSSC